MKTRKVLSALHGGSNNASVVCLSSVVLQSREGWKKLLNAHGKNAIHLQNGSQRSPTTMNDATTCDVEEAALNLRFWLPGLEFHPCITGCVI